MKPILHIPLLLLSSITYGQQPTTIVGTYKFDDKPTSKIATVYLDNKNGYIFYKADYDLDLDGHPRAYHPNNTGLLHNDNGGSNGVMSKSVVVYKGEKPYIQTNNDPAPGYYLSKTSLQLQGYAETDYRRYVNPDEVAYFVLPGGQFKKQGVKVGDIGLVYNVLNKKHAFAIYADSGPRTIIGEGSTLLATQLGIKNYIDKNGRVRGGLDSDNILYIVFPNSGKRAYISLTDGDVQKIGKAAAEKYGDIEILIQNVLKQYTN